MSYYIGLLSGTSVDAIDATLVDINQDKINVVASIEKTFTPEIKSKTQELIKSQSIDLKSFSKLDCQLALEFSKAVLILLDKTNINPSQIKAIGSHGQTIYHQPEGNYKNTIQIGNPHQIAAQTGIDVISNFRNMDIALDGQGAPLAPIIHEKLFKDENKNIAIINLGGIANISFIGRNYSRIKGFDTGPANCLIDEWISIHQHKDYDENGQWAKSGRLNKTLLEQMMADEYFNKPSPKSTGREYFNIHWFDQFKQQFKVTSAVDIQTTLTHLIAASIADSIKKESQVIDEIIVMGGGSKNKYLLSLIQQYSNIKTLTSNSYNFNCDSIEGILFAYLAYLRLNNISIDLASITGSRKQLLVGDLISVNF